MTAHRQAISQVRFRRTGTAALLVLLGLSSCRRTDPSPTAALPSILIVTIDTIRADHLGCYGYFRDTSPNLDALSKESIFFERCIVPMATTLPTHISIFTGLYPIEHGVLANIKHGGKQFVTSPNLQSLAQALKSAGYQTSAFISATPLKRGTGIEAGFDTYDQPEAGTRIAGDTNDRALDWLRHSSQPPFFMWVHYFDPHDPYEPPAPFDEMFQTDELLEKYLSERKVLDQAQRPQERDERRGAVVHARRATNHYDGEIRYTDQEIGRLFQSLKDARLWDSLVVVVIGDHGEGLNQHGEPGHGLIWHEQVHVPFMIRAPGLPPRRVSRTVSAVDVVPTLLSLVPLPLQKSFLDQGSGRNGLAPDADSTAVFSQTSPRQQDYGVETGFSLTDPPWKYIHIPGGKHQLYHLIDDPFELRNVIADHPETAARFCEALGGLWKSQGLKSRKFQAGSTSMSSEQLKELQTMGYTDLESDEFDWECEGPTTQPSIGD